MKGTTYISMAFALAIASTGIAVADDEGDEGKDAVRDTRTHSSQLRQATVAIPCVPVAGLRFSCSNKSSRKSLQISDAKCFIGAGPDREVQKLFEFNGEVAPETTEVEFVACPAVPVPVFCSARVSPRQHARCTLTSPSGGLIAELK